MIPSHIAIIMDGNGRWAKEHGKIRTAGHQAGAEVLKDIVKAADALGVKVLTVYVFSTENWKRPQMEVDFIMQLLGAYLKKEIPEFNANNVQVRFIGSRNGLPESVLEELDLVLQSTAKNTGIILNLAINYGGREEIVSATKKIVGAVQSGDLKVEDIDEKCFENFLYTGDLPAPDLLIRTGGDFRISNFLLWQLAYTEIWTTETYWPDFTPELLQTAVAEFGKRERRFGGLGN
ncbi:MAG: isoprenyl transferase [Phascolarctobacterium sp.]|nr:isoprenyl transferase [Phascolarctobacterium sp.]